MKKIDCKEFDAMIPGFLSDSLGNRELAAFLAHYDHCAKCRDELQIQYLVQVGIRRWEAGGDLNLDKELREAIAAAHTRLRRRRRLSAAAGILEITALASFAALAAGAVLNIL